MVTSNDLIADVLYFIKNDLKSNVTDPIASNREANSSWVMTSYPKRKVNYPMVTIKNINNEANRAGMQTEAMNFTITLEVRIWARNQKEKDYLANQIYKRLRDIQFTASTGSVANNLHDFQLLSAVEVDETGEGTPKSRVLQVRYKFYNI
jgi:hypothetical protein